MDKKFKNNFYNPTRGKLALEGVIKELISWMKEKPEKDYDIVVGCDSSSGKEPSFPVAVVILRVGEGGRFFLKRVNYEDKKFYNWRERVLEEVMLSCDLALLLKERLEQVKLDNYQLRYIHADIGKNGQTKDMIKEVAGLIKGNGFEPKIKPEAYVASTVADRYA